MKKLGRASRLESHKDCIGEMHRWIELMDGLLQARCAQLDDELAMTKQNLVPWLQASIVLPWNTRMGF